MQQKSKIPVNFSRWLSRDFYTSPCCPVGQEIDVCCPEVLARHNLLFPRAWRIQNLITGSRQKIARHNLLFPRAWRIQNLITDSELMKHLKPITHDVEKVQAYVEAAKQKKHSKFLEDLKFPKAYVLLALIHCPNQAISKSRTKRAHDSFYRCHRKSPIPITVTIAAARHTPLPQLPPTVHYLCSP
ncbi:hypothetical protein M5K25_023512 [Dendrobium thyrsiflorum]|uniref:Uncharacterized protein n=1 Tax=Dendrobium thyrsiflorum TaxID=117978 RepID=A0ABD0U8J9_DENTH